MYEASGSKPATIHNNAHILFGHSEIAARVTELRNQTAQEAKRTLNGHLNELQRLKGRVMDAFGGTKVSIEYPDIHARYSVLEILAEDRGWILPDETMYALAEMFTESIRELKGALIKVTTYAFLEKRAPSLELVYDVFHDVIDKKS